MNEKFIIKYSQWKVSTGFFPYIIGEAGKYTSLLWGISSVVKENPEIDKAIYAGLAFGISSLYKYMGIEIFNLLRAQNIILDVEKSLKGEAEKYLSLKEHCDPCGAVCCKESEDIGVPIITYKEKNQIIEFYKNKQGINVKDRFKQISINDFIYYYVTEKRDNKCIFLDNKNNCEIQEVKPLDCRTYPIKAVYREKDFPLTTDLIIDTNCPASKHLSKEFIEEASHKALKSINRFKPEIYNHWIKNHVGWVKKAESIERCLK